MRWLFFVVLVMLAGAVLAKPVVLEGGGWSKPQDGLQARFTFLPGEALAGTRLIQVYLKK